MTENVVVASRDINSFFLLMLRRETGLAWPSDEDKVQK